MSDEDSFSVCQKNAAAISCLDILVPRYSCKIFNLIKSAFWDAMLCHAIVLFRVVISYFQLTLRSFRRKKYPFFTATNRKRNRGKRSLTVSKAHQFPLQIDEFAYKLQITITTEKEINARIVLFDPNGGVQDPFVQMSHSVIYTISRPKMGTWVLTVPKEIGKFDYVARVKSSNVIEFGYYYVLDYNGISSPVAHPMKGECFNVIQQQWRAGGGERGRPSPENAFLGALNPGSDILTYFSRFKGVPV